MNGLGFAKRALLISALCAFGLPQAEAIEIVGGPSPAAHLNDGLLLTAAARRGGGSHGGGVHRHPGGGVHRPPGHPGHRLGAPGHRPGHPGHHPGYRPGHPAYRPGYGHRAGWARPGWYRWAPGGAIAAGAAIGFVSAAAAASWAGAPPQPGLCWYYSDPTRHQGFWDQCP